MAMSTPDTPPRDEASFPAPDAPADEAIDAAEIESLTSMIGG